MIKRSLLTLYFRKVLGAGASTNLIVASSAFATISFFYIFSIATYSKLVVWELQGRVSYYSYFERYVVSNTADNLILILASALWLACSLKLNLKYAIATVYGVVAILLASFNLDTILNMQALLSLPLIIILIIINSVRTKKFLKFNRNLVINYLTIIGIGIGLLAILISIQELYFPPNELISLRNFSYEIYLVFSSFSPILLILLILCFPFKIIINEAIAALMKAKQKLRHDLVLGQGNTKVIIKVLLLSLFMILSTIMVLIPHQSVVNPDNKEVGVDTNIYVDDIGNLTNSTSLNELFNKAFVTIQNGDRPFVLLFLVGIVKIVPSENLSAIFDFVPLMLGPLLVLAIYFLTRQLTSNDVASLLSAFLTAVSFHTLVGIYAGSYANWLALIVGYLSVVFLFRSLKVTNKLNVGMFSVLLITVLFTHIYTWSILTIVMGFFLLLMLKLRYYEKRNVVALLIVLSSSVLLDIVRAPLTGASSGIVYDISPPFGSIVQLGPELYSTRWSTVLDTTLNYFGTLFGNSIIYALCLYWLIRSKLKEVSTIFLLIFLSIGIIPLFFGNWIVQARVFYDIPFQIPAGIALAYLCRRPGGVLIMISTCIWLVAMSILAVSNFYFVPPP